MIYVVHMKQVLIHHKLDILCLVKQLIVMIQDVWDYGKIIKFSHHIQVNVEGNLYLLIISAVYGDNSTCNCVSLKFGHAAPRRGVL